MTSPPPSPDDEPVLEITGLRKSFGAVLATDDVTLTVRAGELHALIGPNGAGKSTLITQICGELAPNAGRILFAGRVSRVCRPMPAHGWGLAAHSK